MALKRATIAASESLVDQLESEAKDRGYTIYSLTNTALEAMLELVKDNYPPDTLKALVRFYKISQTLRIVPVTDWFIEKVTEELYKSNKDKLKEICEQTGEQLAVFLQGQAPTIEDLLELWDDVKAVLPINNVSLRNKDDEIIITITGSGFSHEATECSAWIASKIFESYGLKIVNVTGKQGGIILIKAKA